MEKKAFLLCLRFVQNLNKGGKYYKLSRQPAIKCNPKLKYFQVNIVNHSLRFPADLFKRCYRGYFPAELFIKQKYPGVLAKRFPTANPPAD